MAMELTPVKFLLLFLLLASIGYILFTCTAKLLAWLISRMIGGVVVFRIAGLNGLKEISIHLHRGPVASLTISDLKVCIRKPPGTAGWNIMSWTSKLQLILCDVEVVLRKSKRDKRQHTRKGNKHHSTGRGKWMVVIAKYLNVSVNEIAIKILEAPATTLEIRELDLDTFKDDAPIFSLGIKLVLAPCTLYVGEDTRMHDGSSIFRIREKLLSVGAVPEAEANERFILFSLEQLALTGSLDHDREAGIVIKQLEAACGEAVLNLSAEMMLQEAVPRTDSPTDVLNSVTDEGVRDQVQPDVAARLLARKVPEAVEFSLPKFELNCHYEAKNVSIKNEVKGIWLRSTRSRPLEGSVDVISLMDIQLDLGEIHVFQEKHICLLDIMKVVVSASIEFPGQLIRPLRAEVDVKLGGTQINLHMNRYEDWMQLTLLRLRKVDGSQGSIPRSPKEQTVTHPRICWSGSVSAPEMAVSAYGLDGLALMYISSQTSHLYINAISKHGIVIHTEFGELYVNMIEEGRKFPTECSVGVDSTIGCLMHVSRVSLDSGTDIERENGIYQTPTILLETGASELYLDLSNMKVIMLTLVAMETCLKRFPRKERDRSKGRSKRVGMIKFQLERLLVQFYGKMHIEDVQVSDPKKLNFGSQGGVVIVTEQDAKPRKASIKAAGYNGVNSSAVKQKLSVTLSHIFISLDRNKTTSLMELENGRILYEEIGENEKVVAERVLLAMENVKVVYLPAKVANEVVMHSLLSASNLILHWDPDVHLFLYELALRMKGLLQAQGMVRGDLKGTSRKGRESLAGKDGLQSHKSKSAFALDIEEMSLTAEMADGVEGAVYIQSIFSEDAAIGMLFENIEAAFNKGTVARSERLQVSRVPSLMNQEHKLSSEQSKIMHSLWDIIIQGTGLRIIMPYRLPLRAIEDAVEDMWRGLKLAMAAKRSSICPGSTLEVPKSKRSSSFQVFCIKIHMRGITGEIEEEPLQGWLDEHYHLLRQQSRELLVRERLLEESLMVKGRTAQQQEGQVSEAKVRLEGRKAWEQLQEQSFQEYKRTCLKLTPCRGSGACNSGFQAGFRPSVKRAALMSITAENLDITLTEIKGGRTGMIELIRKLDCVKPETEVPFSRVIGRHVAVTMNSLAVVLRDYSPLLSASIGKCEGDIIFAQQATCFQKQMVQDVFIGRWRRIEMWRSVSGSTPPLKFYSELPIELDSAKVCYGVGYEPAFADVSYAFTVALRKYNLSVREDQVYRAKPVKKEKSLPWWDDMRYYIHGVNSISAINFEWIFLATTDPYENRNMMRMVASTMRINQAEGMLSFYGSNFDMYISSLESLAAVLTSAKKQQKFIHAPIFQLDITMDWNCASGDPLNHYLHAFPNELEPRPQVYDPYRSISLSLIWSFTLRTDKSEDDPGIGLRRNKKCQKLRRTSPTSELQKLGSFRHVDIPFMNLGAQDLIYIFKWWSLYFSPPHKLRSFSRWPRFGIERLPRSGNLSLDKVMTEFILRVDATPASIRHFSLVDEDPAEGLTFSMQKLRYELCYSRGIQQFTFEGKRDILDLVYQGLDVHLLKTKLKKSSDANDNLDMIKRSAKVKHLLGFPEALQKDGSQKLNSQPAKLKEDGFLFSTDCFTIRKQSPKADPNRLSSWRENVQLRDSEVYKLSESENSGASDPTCSDPSDDDSYNVVLADNCLRVSLCGLKLFWTVPNRDAVWAWVRDISKPFEAPKPSPSRQYAQRKLIEEKQRVAVVDKQDGVIKRDSSTSAHHGTSNSRLKEGPEEEEGTLQFMVNVIQPQFNLHSEDAHGRFLLAAASGRVLARSFHSILYVGFEMIEQALGAGVLPLQGNLPEISWKRRELSVILEHVQAHVAPTDVDPGAGLQWLPRIPRGAPKVKRTGALLERVFLPCSMYFQYIRHKGGTTDCKVKPLKELSFNSPNITATMTSRQFHIMVDVLSNLLFARLPKPRRGEEEEDIEEEADEVVPDGVEEVELARIKLEQAERDVKLIFDDLRTIKQQFRDGISSPDQHSAGESPEGSLRMALTKTSALVRRLEMDLAFKRKARKAACVSVRLALQRAAQQRLMDKEKGKSPSAAMRIAWSINKVVWSMLSDGETFAEAEISSMILNVDRDFSDIGVARFTIKSFVVKNCLHNAKSNMVLSAWNPPAEWGRNVMLRVDARQGAPKEGLSLLELFQVEIYPLKIHLTETMYTMMWEYFFPGDEEDPQKRQEVWKGSTSSGTKRSRKGLPVAAEMTIGQTKETISKASVPGTPPMLHGLHLPQRDFNRLDFALAAQALAVSKAAHRTEIHLVTEHRRSSSFDRGWDENEAEFLATEVMLYSNAVSLGRSATAPGSDEILAALSASSPAVENDATKLKENRRAGRAGKPAQEDKKESKNRKIFLEIHNIKISQVELLVSYEGSKFSVNELRLLMDTFTRSEFTGSWRRLFSRVKKHIIWGVLKSVTGMQGKKFKDKMQAQGNAAFEDSDSNSSDSCTSKICRVERFPIPHFQKHSDRAGEGFVSSIRGLFNSQRRKARALVRTMRGEGHAELQHDWSDGEADLANLARQLNISKAKQLLRRHSKKLRSSRSKGAILLGERYCSSSPRASPYHSDAESSSGSSTYEDFDQHLT